ncbi:MAG: hypothetical protein RLY69_356 [Verrucomicrobiota bacterium]
MKEAIDFILHIQEHLTTFTSNYGSLVYGLLFLIIFCETGLVVTPFLPGDSLLFAVGAVAADPVSGLNIWIAGLIILVAAIIGDTVNYWIGKKFGSWMMRTFPKVVKPSHIQKTNEFYQRYGGKTIIIARFVPFFNVIGAILWVVTILPAGWFFGNIPIVKKNFELVVLGIIAFSLLPMVIEILRAKYKSPKQDS